MPSIASQCWIAFENTAPLSLASSSAPPPAPHSSICLGSPASPCLRPCSWLSPALSCITAFAQPRRFWLEHHCVFIERAPFAKFAGDPSDDQRRSGRPGPTPLLSQLVIVRGKFHRDELVVVRRVLQGDEVFTAPHALQLLTLQVTRKERDFLFLAVFHASPSLGCAPAAAFCALAIGCQFISSGRSSRISRNRPRMQGAGFLFAASARLLPFARMLSSQHGRVLAAFACLAASAALAGSGPRIVVDPGHGGFQEGALSADGVAEKALSLQIACQLKE